MCQRLSTCLREISAEDYHHLNLLRSNQTLQKKLLGAREPITEKVGDWLVRRKHDGWIMAVTDGKDSFLGYVQLSDIHRANRTAWFGICLTESARGLGHGSAATRLALGHAHQEMSLRKVQLRVREDNPASRLYKRLGFRNVGILRDEYDDGDRFYDVHIMELLFNRSVRQ